MKYETARQYVVITHEGIPPFILAEVAGCHLELDPPVVQDGEVVPWSRLSTNAEELASRESILGREELLADPLLRLALERWEAGDDSPVAEWERQGIVDAGNDPLSSDEEFRARAQDAIAHGPIPIPGYSPASIPSPANV